MGKNRLSSAAVLFHPDRERAVAEAKILAGALTEEGVSTYCGPAFDAPTLRREVRSRELVVALGGDGTILSVAREAAGMGVPTLGVNLGRVGFLAELTPQLLPEAIPKLLAREFWIESRRTLQADWDGNGTGAPHLALNEVALARGTSTRAIRVAVFLDGFEYATHTADGVLVATATGSTAYSLAAGGPIIYPESTDILLTPVAPHLHIGRSVVLPKEVTVHLELREDRDAMLSIDGQTECPFQVGDRVEIRVGRKRALFARLGSRDYFYAAVARRLR